MEKLKAKHDHKLTDILKVAIFGLMLILPGLILLPSMLYYGVNEHATAPTEQVEKIEYERIDFNQLVKLTNNEYIVNDLTYLVKDNNITIVNGTSNARSSLQVLKIDNIKVNHKYYLKGFKNTTSNQSMALVCYNENNNYLGYYLDTTDYIFQPNYFDISYFWLEIVGANSSNITCNNIVFQPQLFDLTQMFGVGNEPTAQQFNSWFTKDYYNYTTSEYQILEIPTGTYETYTDITSQIQYNWNSLWQQPLFSWTNYTILKQGLDNFTYVFGITQTSYINNLIVYELIMVAIYIVIDIVLTLFKWLTHLIGEK